VSLKAWGTRDEVEEGRGRRLAGAYAAAFAFVAVVLVVFAVFGGEIKRQVLEDDVEVKLVLPEKKPDAPPPAPPPPAPSPMPRAKSAVFAPPPPLGPKVSAPPTEIPKERPAEADPSSAIAEVPYGEGDPKGCVGCTGKRGGGVVRDEEVPPKEPASPSRAYQITEVSTPPVALEKRMPSYPEEARKNGIDAVVVVKFIVTEVGQVSDIVVLSGHPALDPTVIASLMTWRFSPGTLDGKPVRVARKMKFPFHLKTAT
jgi:protein TonB